jgi:hypothetical protein
MAVVDGFGFLAARAAACPSVAAGNIGPTGRLMFNMYTDEELEGYNYAVPGVGGD